jgi:DNA-binding Xre family transcriptional regulator
MKIDEIKLFATLADKGISIKELHEKTGLSYGTICAIRRGSNIKTTTLGVVARFLNVKSIDLIKTEEK